MQINNIIRYYQISTSKDNIIKEIDKPRVNENMEQLEISYITSRNEKWFSYFGK